MILQDIGPLPGPHQSRAKFARRLQHLNRILRHKDLIVNQSSDTIGPRPLVYTVRFNQERVTDDLVENKQFVMGATVPALISWVIINGLLHCRQNTFPFPPVTAQKDLSRCCLQQCCPVSLRYVQGNTLQSEWHRRGQSHPHSSQI